MGGWRIRTHARSAGDAVRVPDAAVDLPGETFGRMTCANSWEDRTEGLAKIAQGAR